VSSAAGYPSAEGLRQQELREAEERALADLRRWGELYREFGGGWWVVPGPINGPGQHKGPHEGRTIRRLVDQRLVVLVRGRSRCLPWPKGAK
jgi:hypothetical protein